MNPRRRDLLLFSGGAALGALFTPVPWRLLGDSAIWTQNWSWMPRLPRGETSSKETVCTLCPAGCPLKAHCRDDKPFAMLPREHAICPAGLVAHHWHLHPLRLRQTLFRGQPSTSRHALAAARNALPRGGVALLDLLPGRVASRLNREHVKRLGGSYLTPPPTFGATAQAVARLLPAPRRLVMDLAAARVVLSLSTPLLEGWAAPQFSTRPPFRLLQAESRKSYTAERADEFYLLKPGGEAALLLALLRRLAPHCPNAAHRDALPGAWLASLSDEQLAHRAGVSPETITHLAAQLRETPALIIADGDPLGGPLGEPALTAAAALNAACGLSAFRALPPLAPPDPLAQVPDGSLHLLLIDEPLPGVAMPWALIAPKLAPGATIVALTWNRRQYAELADWLVPVPVFLEGLQEAPPRHDAPSPTLITSEGWLAPPEDALPAADFIAKLAGSEETYAAALAASPAGDSPQPVNGIPRLLPPDVDPDALFAAALAEPPEVALIAFGWPLASVSPLLAKLWRESELKVAPGSAAAHPDTLRRLPRGHALADAKLPPGVVALCANPALAQRARPDASGAWLAPASSWEVQS